MPGTPTSRFAIPTLAGSTFARAIDTEVNDALAAIDSKMTGYSSGTLGSRPPSTPGSPGIEGRIYRATDSGQLFMDTGTDWVEFIQPGGFHRRRSEGHRALDRSRGVDDVRRLARLTHR